MRGREITSDIQDEEFGIGRWELIGIHSLLPLPNDLEDFQTISNIEYSTDSLHYHYSRDCPESYMLEDSFDEHRELINCNNPIIDPRNEF